MLFGGRLLTVTTFFFAFSSCFWCLLVISRPPLCVLINYLFIFLFCFLVVVVAFFSNFFIILFSDIQPTVFTLFICLYILFLAFQSIVNVVYLFMILFRGDHWNVSVPNLFTYLFVFLFCFSVMVQSSPLKLFFFLILFSGRCVTSAKQWWQFLLATVPINTYIFSNGDLWTLLISGGHWTTPKIMLLPLTGKILKST